MKKMFGSTYVDIVITLLILFWLLKLYFEWCYRYWANKGIETIKPKFPIGNLKSPWDNSEPDYKPLDRCYEEFRVRGLKHGGIYSLTKAIYMPIDIQYIKNILITDFQYFHDRDNYTNLKDDPVSVHLLTLEGKQWKNMRIKLTPAFTTGKMKTMFNTMLACGDQMIEAIEKNKKEGNMLDIKEIIACYTTDIIGSCAFGIDCNCFGKPELEFRTIGKRMLKVDKLRNFVRLITSTYPNMARALGVPHLPTVVSKFYFKLAQEIVEYRKKNNIRRNDFLQVLMEIHKEFENGKEIQNPLSIGEIAANFFLFFIAGFETSSTTMSFLFYELCQNQEIQDKIRTEIETVLAEHDGKITYESLADMKYSKQALDETLRKYPVVPLFKRKCTVDYKIPGTDVILEKGTSVYIPVNGVHRNPDLFPDPDKFDPTRFSDTNKGNIVAGSYLGFGEGPRICIGIRFGMMQMKIALIKLLTKYKVKLNPKTKMPIEVDPTSISQAPKGNIWIDLESIDFKGSS